MRHALWQFLLTCAFGPRVAEEIGDIHEQDPSDACDSAMDQFNNGRARDLVGVLPCPCQPPCGSNNNGFDALVQELIRRIETGEFVIDRHDPRVSPPCPGPQP